MFTVLKREIKLSLVVHPLNKISETTVNFLSGWIEIVTCSITFSTTNELFLLQCFRWSQSERVGVVKGKLVDCLILRSCGRSFKYRYNFIDFVWPKLFLVA